MRQQHIILRYGNPQIHSPSQRKYTNHHGFLPRAFRTSARKCVGKLTAKEKKELADTCTIEDVWKVATDIQKKQAKLRKLGNMNKIKPYLDGLKRYGDVIVVFVSAKPEILAFIWVGYTGLD